MSSPRKRERECAEKTNEKRVTFLLEAADEIKTPEKKKPCPITYNGVPFSGVKIINTGFFAKGIEARKAKEAEDIRDKMYADAYGVSVETFRKGEECLAKTLQRMKNTKW